MSWNFRQLREKEKECSRNRLYVLILLVLVSAFLLMGGCTLAERFGSKENRTPTIEDELNFQEEEVAVPEEQEMAKVTFYLKDQEKNCLVPVTREIPKVTGIARATLEAMFESKEEGNLRSPFPAGAEVKDLNIKPDGTCVVDLNLDATKLPEGDPKEEALAVYAIVNTLTEFSTVQKVQIMVEGQVNKTFAGHIPVDLPLMRNLSYVAS
ncbi:MAG: GerMN domain-containing protein [Thermacetogeniaceae bacterium]|jgi:spore germination protein GerM|nr:GerMN domain-containing protein [Syntrophomonadaceae bacterium]